MGMMEQLVGNFLSWHIDVIMEGKFIFPLLKVV
jgi:hypothetical protein